MFDNNNNNNNGSVSVNTKLKQFYGELSTMTIGGWNDNISIKLYPLDNVDENGKRNYNFNKKLNTALVQEKIQALLTKINEKIKPAIEEGKTELVTAGFQVGKAEGKSGVFIEWREDPETKEWDVYFAIYKNIKEDNTSDDFIRYKFNKTDVIEDYDNEKGTGKDVKVESEFETFVALLNKAIDELGVVHHSIKYRSEIETRSTSFGGNNNYSNNSSYKNSGGSNYSADTGAFEDSDMPF